MICPLCAAELSGAAVCPGCGCDLTEWLQIACQPDLLYNEALTKLRRGRGAEAAALLCRAAGARPGDAEILRLWAETVWAEGDPSGAARIYLDAAAAGGSPEIEARCGGGLALPPRERPAGRARAKPAAAPRGRRAPLAGNRAPDRSVRGGPP